MRTVRTRTVVVTGLLVALLLAGVASQYASARPDGLERVATDLGFASSGRDSVAADGPLADYVVAGVGAAGVSGGVAGVVGCVVVLAGTMLLMLVRRRRPARRPAPVRGADPTRGA
jgi:cobalt/nickel transport protein